MCHSLSLTQDSVFDVNGYTENPEPKRSGSTSEELRGNPLHKSTETENKNKNEDSEEVQRGISHELPDWQQDFRENLVHERSRTEPWGNPEQGSQDTSKSSHELPMDPRAKVEPGSGKQVVPQSHGETLRLRIEMLPVLLMNYQWSREQK